MTVYLPWKFYIPNTHTNRTQIATDMGSSERQEFLDYSYCETCSEQWEEACCNCIKVWQPNFFGADSGLDEMSCCSYLCHKFIVCFCCWWYALFYSCWVCVYFVLCCGPALCVTCVNRLCKRNKEGQSDPGPAKHPEEAWLRVYSKLFFLLGSSRSAQAMSRLPSTLCMSSAHHRHVNHIICRLMIYSWE